MRLRTLGKLELEGSTFSQAKALLLLAYLAVEGRQERRRLAELFWFDSEDPLNNLGTTLTRLGKGAAGTVERNDVQLWTTVECDAVELLEAHERGDSEACVALYAGTFLEGVRPQDTSTELEEWFYARREAMGDRVRQALLDLAEDHAGNGEFGPGAEMAQRAYVLSGAPEPEPEQLKRLFVLLQAGEHGQASEVRKEAAGYELNLNISVEDARAALQTGADTTMNEARHNLPVQPTEFVGREAEKTKIAELLNDPACRLLTIMGPGGFGKTRLAIEVAAAQLGSFPDGVFFVPFAPVTSPTSMPFAIADTLGLGSAGHSDSTEQLFGYLENRRALLLLDNLEHLLDGVDLIHDLWEKTRNIKLLVTSREQLNLHAERVFILSGLTAPKEVPVEQSDAVKLFLQTARNRGYEVALSESTTPSVIRICQLVGGMPLAIELAANWLQVLPPQGIVEQLEEGLDLLEVSTRDLPERHSSIRAVFDRSWELLSEDERGSLRRLSVFQGGFSLEAAGKIAEAGLPVLASLASKSLVTLTPSGRYEQHPLVLEYARERLAEHAGERLEVGEKHAHFYLELLQRHHLELSTSKFREARELFDAELPNIQVAWDWAIGNLELARIEAAAFPLHKVLDGRGRDEEVIELFSRAAARLDEGNPEHHGALGYTLIGQGAVHKMFGPYATKARSLLEQGVELLRPLGEDLGVALALSWLVNFDDPAIDEAQARAYLREGFPIARRTGTPHLIGRFLNQHAAFEEGSSGSSVEDDKKLHEQTLGELRRLGDPFHLTHAMIRFGGFLIHHQAFEEGKALLKEGLERARDYQFGGSIAFALVSLIEAALMTGDLAEAEALAADLLQRSRDDGGDTTAEVGALAGLGVVSTRRGNLPVAEGLLSEALQVARRVDSLTIQVEVLLGQAELRIAQGRAVDAAQWMSFVLHLQATGIVAFRWLLPIQRVKAQRVLDGLRDRISPEELAVAMERGKELTLDDIVNDLLPGL